MSILTKNADKQQILSIMSRVPMRRETTMKMEQMIPLKVSQFTLCSQSYFSFILFEQHCNGSCFKAYPQRNLDICTVCRSKVYVYGRTAIIFFCYFQKKQILGLPVRFPGQQNSSKKCLLLLEFALMRANLSFKS